MHEAKTQLSQLVDLALRGEDVVIARRGRPAVRLVPVAAAGARPLGLFADEIVVAEDFDAPLPAEELDGFGLPAA